MAAWSSYPHRRRESFRVAVAPVAPPPGALSVVAATAAILTNLNLTM